MTRSRNDAPNEPKPVCRVQAGADVFSLGSRRLELAAKIACRVEIDPTTGCHNWTGFITDDGYGRIAIYGFRPASARVHRVTYELANGPIPDGLQIDHRCRNRACCNPEHLEAVTPRENTLRGNSHVARQARATHCQRGHEFTEANTRHVHGHRRCRECLRIVQRLAHVRVSA